MSLLRELVQTARETIDSGYYRSRGELKEAPSLVQAILRSKTPDTPGVIAEIKPATPTRGKLVDGGYEELMQRFLTDGACGLSVLTEPRHFHGSLTNLKLAARTGAPTLMKDFILAEEQIDCAASLGASAVLLILGILPKSRVDTLIEYAHVAEREVLLECSTREEVEAALETETDMVGVNNRDLKTFAVQLDRTVEFTRGLELDRPLVSLSGFASRADVLRVAPVADAILVGTSLIEGRTSVKELKGA